LPVPTPSLLPKDAPNPAEALKGNGDMSTPIS
jgi:hypothetical protein